MLFTFRLTLFQLQHHFRRERTRTPSPSPQPRSPSVRAARQTLDGSDIGNDIVAVDLQKEVTLLRQRLAEVEREKNDMAELLANKDGASRQAEQMWQARDAAWEELSTHLYHECDPKDPTPASQLHTKLFSEMDNLKKLTELPKVQKFLPDGCGTFLANAVQEVEGLIHRAVGEAQSGVGGEAMEVDRRSLEVLLAELPVKPGHDERMKE